LGYSHKGTAVGLGLTTSLTLLAGYYNILVYPIGFIYSNLLSSYSHGNFFFSGTGYTGGYFICSG
jgi:hypothetical protein